MRLLMKRTWHDADQPDTSHIRSHLRIRALLLPVVSGRYPACPVPILCPVILLWATELGMTEAETVLRASERPAVNVTRIDGNGQGTTDRAAKRRA